MFIGSNITGEIKWISSEIFAKCLIAFTKTEAELSKVSVLLPVIIVPSANSRAITGTISFLPTVSFNSSARFLAGKTTFLSSSFKLTCSMISFAASKVSLST